MVVSVQFLTQIFNFDNINTASVEFSDEIYNAGVHFVGKFVSVDDESNTYDFEVASKRQSIFISRLHIMMIEIDNTPSANHLILDSVTGGLWLGTGTENDGFKPAYSVI